MEGLVWVLHVVNVYAGACEEQHEDSMLARVPNRYYVTQQQVIFEVYGSSVARDRKHVWLTGGAHAHYQWQCRENAVCIVPCVSMSKAEQR